MSTPTIEQADEATDRTPDEGAEAEELTVDTLVEDVSIDGMCGVY